MVDLSGKCNKKGMAYVALSRVKTLEGLAIISLDAKKLLGDAPCDTEALNEIERLRATLPQIDESTSESESDVEMDSEEESEGENVEDSSCRIV